jgi:hypothetical protein
MVALAPPAMLVGVWALVRGAGVKGPIPGPGTAPSICRAWFFRPTTAFTVALGSRISDMVAPLRCTLWGRHTETLGQ